MFLKKAKNKGILSDKEIIELVKSFTAQKRFISQKVLVVIPDSTRSCPVSLIFKAICNELCLQVKALDFLIALGTHSAMSEEQIGKMLRMTKRERFKKYKRDIHIFNHNFHLAKELVTIGTIKGEEVAKISNGLLQEDIPIKINRKIMEYNHIIIVGPVFPHEFVGFSGGYKYLFPGISGPEIINKFHWLGALISNPKIIGFKDTPPRTIIDKAASFISTPMSAICLVMDDYNPCGIYIGDPLKAWSAAVKLSKKRNIIYKEKQFKRVFAVMPNLYNELWTAGKGMYKLEQIVADRGELIIYGPQINRISKIHGNIIKKIGYHTRDYFLVNQNRFNNVPELVKAHCAHVKGIGTYKNGKEKPRITVKLATGIPKKVCEEINLDYIDPDTINLDRYLNKEDEDVLLVKKAGEKLYKLFDGSMPEIDKL
jgi:nickel-dependent lactate racemase